MLTARYRQSPEDLTRYVLNLSHWLADAETINTVDVTADAAIQVVNVIVLQPSETAFQFYLGGGEPGGCYDVTFLTRTNQGQKRTDRVQLMVGD